MMFLTYVAIGLLLAYFTCKVEAVKAALPDLYVVYVKETKEKGLDVMKQETFNKAMVIGLLAIYGLIWPIIVVKILRKLSKSKDDDNTPKPPKVA